MLCLVIHEMLYFQTHLCSCQGSADSEQAPVSRTLPEFSVLSTGSCSSLIGMASMAGMKGS